MQHDTRKASSDNREDVLDYVQEAVDHLKQHLAKPLTLGQIANHVHLSKCYLAHELKRVTGFAPIEYLISLRMNQACLPLATTNLPIVRVAESVGIANSRYFLKLFKRRLGMTSGAYRASMRS